jgi:hypothetical protein
MVDVPHRGYHPDEVEHLVGGLLGRARSVECDPSGKEESATVASFRLHRVFWAFNRIPGLGRKRS